MIITLPIIIIILLQCVLLTVINYTNSCALFVKPISIGMFFFDNKSKTLTQPLIATLAFKITYIQKVIICYSCITKFLNFR